MFKFALFFATLFVTCKFEDYCFGKNNDCNTKNYRYLLYDVNPPEGFNLRRDVYMRMAVLAHKLKNSGNHNFKLVLPPWSHLVHWEFNRTPEQIPWSFYFDINSMKKFAPVIDMYEFFNELNEKYSKVKIEEMYVLQHFEDMFETGNFEDRMQIEDCIKEPNPTFFYYNNITAVKIQCLSFHGPATKLSSLLEESSADTILIDHAEVALHEMFGNKLYWQARRSMRFNKELQKIAKDFREKHLNANDSQQNVILPDDWTLEKSRRNALGGPYLAVHMRRKDFVRSRPKDTPSIESVGTQIVKLLEKLKLDAVFIATDAPSSEYNQLVDLIGGNYKIVRFKPSDYVKDKFKSGGGAIIDQIICSYARYFIGSAESTFSFRIQEEREILGFPVETTFNALCNNDGVCSKPSKWKIVY